jgi:hypothetical protein
MIAAYFQMLSPGSLRDTEKIVKRQDRGQLEKKETRALGLQI